MPKPMLGIVKSYLRNIKGFLNRNAPVCVACSIMMDVLMNERVNPGEGRRHAIMMYPLAGQFPTDGQPPTLQSAARPAATQVSDWGSEDGISQVIYCPDSSPWMYPSGFSRF